MRLPVCKTHGPYREGLAGPSRACRDCWRAAGEWFYDRRQKPVSKGRARGQGQSSKGKGRSACLLVQAVLLDALKRHVPTLEPGDIWVKATSQVGVDLHMSPLAIAAFPFALEIKNAEALNIWSALKQAEYNAPEGRSPIVFFKRANTELFVAMLAATFFKFYAPPEKT